MTEAQTVQPIKQNSLQDNIQQHLQEYFMAHDDSSLPAPGLYSRIMPLMEKPLIEMTLQATRGNQLKAAHVLGINRNTLRKKIGQLDINIARLLE